MPLVKQSPLPPRISVEAGTIYEIVLNTYTWGEDYDDVLFVAHSNAPTVVAITPIPVSDTLTITGISTASADVNESEARIVVTAEDDDGNTESYPMDVTVTAAIPMPADPLVESVASPDDLPGGELELDSFEANARTSFEYSRYIGRTPAQIRQITPLLLRGAGVTLTAQRSQGTITITGTGPTTYLYRLTFVDTNGTAITLDVTGEVRSPLTGRDPRIEATLDTAIGQGIRLPLDAYNWALIWPDYDDYEDIAFEAQFSPRADALIRVDDTDIGSGHVTLWPKKVGSAMLEWDVQDADDQSSVGTFRVFAVVRDAKGKRPNTSGQESHGPGQRANLPIDVKDILYDDLPPTTLPDPIAHPSDARYRMAARVRAVVSEVTIEGGVMTIRCEADDRWRGSTERPVRSEDGGPFKFVGVYEQGGVVVGWPTVKQE